MGIDGKTSEPPVVGSQARSVPLSHQAAAGDTSADSGAEEAMGISKRWAKAAGLAMACLALIAVVSWDPVRRLAWEASNTETSHNLISDVEYGTENIEVVPAREHCSKIGQSCSQTKCCRFSGYWCYRKNETWSSCLKSCKPGEENGGEEENEPTVQKGKPLWDPPAHAVPFFAPAPPGPWTCARPDFLKHMKPAKITGTKLFCWSVGLTDDGKGKETDDISLLRTQLHTRTTIFGCEDWSVFSNVKTWLSPGPPKEQNFPKLWTTVIDYPKIVKRPNVHSWMNTPLFVNAWKVIREEGKWAKNDWTVKVDVYTVFLPMRLRKVLHHQRVTEAGVYLENCMWVRYGFHGSLAVMSKKAAETMSAHAEDCLTVLDWTHGSHTHFRYSGEDKFTQKCLDHYGVDKVPSRYNVDKLIKGDPAMGLHTTITCPAHIPKKDKKVKKWHPDCTTMKTAGLNAFRDPEMYFECLAQAQEKVEVDV